MSFVNNFINSISNKRIILYTSIVIVCVIAIGIAIYFQFFYVKDKEFNWTSDENIQESKEAEFEKLRTTFNSTFNNSIRKVNGEGQSIQKIDDSKDFVYTMYQIDLYSENKYDINLNLPVLNINHDNAKKINNEIDQIFGSKANDVVQSKDALSVYNLDYVAYLKDDILSLVIKATLKELDYAQRVIIKTYNYDVVKNEEVSLGQLLLKKNLDKNDVYNKVIEEINSVITENEALSQIGYEVFKRDNTDKRYLLENTDTYFIDQNDYLYLIYAYGNNNFTSELDIVIF